MSDNTINLMLKRSVTELNFWLVSFVKNNSEDTAYGGVTLQQIGEAAGMPMAAHSQSVGYIALKHLMETLVATKQVTRGYGGTQLIYGPKS